MKFRISPAAAAVFLAAGLFTSGLRAASAPAAIPFENDAAFNVTLSNTNPSKVVVDGELITSISGPAGLTAGLLLSTLTAHAGTAPC